jgi:uncharacterized protein
MNINIYNLRLVPGEDLRLSLIAMCKQEQILAGAIVSAVGSLQSACLRYANGKVGTRLTGPFEIVSLSGTLSVAGIHIHLSIADSEGLTRGGHLVEGNTVHTTCELVIIEQRDLHFLRELDPHTGYPELVIKERS